MISANKLSDLKVEQNGGIHARREPSAFKQKFLDLEVIALGPFTVNAYSVMEKVRLDTIQPTIDEIRKIIESQSF